MDLLVENVRIENDPEIVDIRITDGRFTEIGPALRAGEAETVIDGANRLCLPPIIESHVHLDSALTAGQPRWNESGTLFEGIEVWSERKAELSVRDVKDRAGRAIRQQARFGVQYISHPRRVTDPDLTALRALLELAKSSLTPSLQRVAFPQEGTSPFAPCCARRRKWGGRHRSDPHFGSPGSTRSVHCGTRSACAVRPLIVHCDEIDDEAPGLTLATLAYENQRSARHRESHHGDAFLQQRVRESTDAVADAQWDQLRINPLVNTLQARRHLPEAPGCHGPELTEAGLNVGFRSGRHRRS